MDLIALLKELGNAVNEELPELNWGGCGVYAAYVTERLKVIGIDASGVVSTYADLDEYDNSLTVMRKKKNPRTYAAWRNSGLCVAHILVQFRYDGKLWLHDSENTICNLMEDATCGGRILDGTLSAVELMKIASTPHGWNTSFNRRTGIPKVRKMVREYLPTALYPMKKAA